MKRNIFTSILNPNNIQNLKYALFTDLMMLPIKTGGAGLSAQQGGCSKPCYQHSDGTRDSSHLPTKADPGHNFHF